MKNQGSLESLAEGNFAAANPLMGNPFAQMQQPQQNQLMPAFPAMNPLGMGQGMQPMFGNPMFGNPMANPFMVQMMDEMRFKNQLH
jgi:hypothetical protein